MKIFLLFTALSIAQFTYSQVSVEFKELDYGLGKVERGERSSFNFVKRTDSIPLELKASFGISYMLQAEDSVDIDFEIEWLFPKKMIDSKGKKSKSLRYTTKKPTNTHLAHTYTFDEPFEMLEGQWILNIYFEKKKLFSRSFLVYK